jgi:ESS family glutamate:Na+ symporter
LIGGTLGLILVGLGVVSIEPGRFEAVAYHLFNISFISLGLTREKDARPGPDKRTTFLKGTAWMALIQGVTFPLQALVGGAVVMASGFFGLDLFATFGFLCPLGFNEGPGQALSFGKVWEGVGFTHAATLGLTFAAIGFLFSFLIGVPLAHWGIRKRLVANPGKTLSPAVLTGVVSESDPGEPAGNLKLHTGNMDSLSFQAAMVGMVYGLTYFVVTGLGRLLDPGTAKMLWGFLFFFGLAIAILVRSLMDRTGTGHLMDPGIQRRITGWSVDFLIVATIPAIQVLVVWHYILPIAVISLINGVLTFLAVFYLGRRLACFPIERICAIFGVVTGTASCGLLLLRIVDPEFKTPVALELAVMNLLVLPILFSCLMLVNAVIWWGWPLWMALAGFAGILGVSLVLMKQFRLIESPGF